MLRPGARLTKNGLLERASGMFEARGELRVKLFRRLFCFKKVRLPFDEKIVGQRSR